MLIVYSGRSAPSAKLIAEESDGIEVARGRDRMRGDINWGRYKANTQLNPDITNVTNKRVMRELFKEHGVPMPRLACLDEVCSMRDDDKFVGRPDYHSKGRGLWVCNSRADVERALRGTRRKRAATHFMEYIEAPREYRVHVFKGMSIRISEKQFFIDDDGKKDYTTIKPSITRLAYIRDAAKKAVEAVGLDFGAVDILANDEGQCWVLEVNAAPGLGGSMPKLYAEIFKRWEEGDWDELR